MAKNINTQSTALAKSQEKRFIKSLARIDITLFIVAAIISLDTIATIAKGGSQSLFWAVFVALTFLIPISMLMAETGSAFAEDAPSKRANSPSRLRQPAPVHMKPSMSRQFLTMLR